jgi:hypothetical protein
MNSKRLFICFLLIVPFSCTNKDFIKLENEKKGTLRSIFKLELFGTKQFTLDSVTAPRPQYIQLFSDSLKNLNFTFLNTFNNSIYFYNYNSLKLVKKVVFNKGASGIKAPLGYFIKNMDSIYVYNIAQMEVVLGNDKGVIKNKISLKGKGNIRDWSLHYPQYYPETVVPFIATTGKLLLTGQSFSSIPETAIRTFKFTAEIDLGSGKVNFIHKYPENLYGSNSNWEGGPFTRVFSELHPNGDKLIYSFPVSHNLYIADIKSESYAKVYGGGNFAGTIQPVNFPLKDMEERKSSLHFMREDLYTAIKYDKYRKVYYRFLLNGLPNATLGTRRVEKPLTIIIMDEKFNYLGENTLGTCEEWYWPNSFVTKEGLNIEYVGKKPNEDHLLFKIFTIKKI